MPIDNLLLTSLGLLLVLLNGFFVAAEFAIVKLRRTQAEELAKTHGLRGRVLHTVRAHLDSYLSACQLGITLASLALGWIGEPAFARLIEPALGYAGITDPKVIQSISFAFAFGLISFLHIVVGELAPKSLAIRRAETVSLNTALPLYVFYWVMYPFIRVLNGAANSILRRLGVEMASEGDEAHSVDELRTVLRASHHHGELGATETQILTRGLDLGDLVVGDVMRPLAELVWLSLDATIDEVLAEVRTSRFTRYPVRHPESQRFVGLLHIKDLLTAPERLRDIRDLQSYLRTLPHVEDGEQLEPTLVAFRRGDPHFAIVTDSLGTEIGFVTFEHVVEALFGPVEDEFSKSGPVWQRAADRSVTGAGSLSLLSLEEALGTPVPEVDANSVGGLVTETLGRLPGAGERIVFPDFDVEVLKMDGHRIDTVKSFAARDSEQRQHMTGSSKLHDRPRIVVLGGGFGGLWAVRALAGVDADITLIDRHNHHLFQPLLYQVATAGLAAPSIAAPLRYMLRRQKNVTVLLGTVEQIDPANRTVTMDGQLLQYDRLVVATGSTHGYFGHDEWAREAPGLKTLDDALRIRERILTAFERAEAEKDSGARDAWLTFVVIGAGPTGVELAGTLAEIAHHTLPSEFRRIDPATAKIVLLEAGPRVLSNLDEDLSISARRQLERLGVTVRTGKPVTDVGAGYVQVGDERLSSRTVLWAAGVAASPLGRQLGVPVDRAGRVPVLPDLSVPGHAEIYVIGDLASVRDGESEPARTVPGVAAAAKQMGAYVGRAIRASLEARVPGKPRPFRYHDYGTLATIGRRAAVVQLPRAKLSGRVAWWFWLVVHLVYLIGFRNRLVVLIDWAWAYFTYQRSARIVISDD